MNEWCQKQHNASGTIAFNFRFFIVKKNNLLKLDFCSSRTCIGVLGIANLRARSWKSYDWFCERKDCIKNIFFLLTVSISVPFGVSGNNCVFCRLPSTCRFPLRLALRVDCRRAQQLAPPLALPFRLTLWIIKLTSMRRWRLPVTRCIRTALFWFSECPF